MSYSFTVREATKDAAVTAVDAELKKVLAGQPVHAKDKAQALAAAESFIGLLDPEESQSVVVSMNGSISTNAAGVTNASVSVQAYCTILP
jgi:hypothetical protein